MIEADGKVTVYNLAGERVLDNAPADMLRNLEKGIYIVNGKKQAVKEKGLNLQHKKGRLAHHRSALSDCMSGYHPEPFST